MSNQVSCFTYHMWKENGKYVMSPLKIEWVSPDKIIHETIEEFKKRVDDIYG